MKWPQWNPDLTSEIRALGILAMVIAVIAAFMIYFPNPQQYRANAGFGPEWDCVAQARGGPVCIKKAGR